MRRGNRPSIDRQDAQLERLMKERDELRAREQKTRAEAEKANERLANLVSVGRTFASTMRSRAEERRRSRHLLATQHAMTRMLAEAKSLEEATPEILKILGDGLGWAIRILWLVDEEAGVLRCNAVGSSSDGSTGAYEAECRDASVRPGEGLPGRVWARGGPVWVEDVLDNEGFFRAEAAARDGLHTALAFPIQNDTTVGVVELLSGEASPPDDELLLLATILGGQIAQFVERRRAEEALRRSEERQRSLIAATSSIVWSAAPNGEFVEEMPSWQHFTGQTPARYKGFGWLGAVHPEDRPGACKDLSGNETPVETRYRLMRHDGQYRRVISRGVPILDASGEVREWIGTITDVEEERRAEEVRERFLAQWWRSHAEADERYRIGRELHDRVAHLMGVVHQSIELYKAFLPRDPSRAEAKLALAQDMAKTALNSTRDLSMALRESATDEDLKDSLSNFLEISVPPEIEARLSVEGDASSIPTRAREQLFLILREAARNAVSHSECHRLSICLNITAREVVGLVEDDGRGFEPEEPSNGGSGLRYMKERAALVTGVCEVSSEPSRGTSVRVSIPLEP